MYPSHWGLSRSPFGPQLDPRFFHAADGHEEALARMHFLVEQHHRLGLLLGDGGSGKSLLLEMFAGRVRTWGRPVVRMSLLGIDPGEFLAETADQLRTFPAADTSSSWQLWQQIERRLREHRYQRLETVLLLDDADLATAEVLTQVARIAKHDMTPHSHLTVILAGQDQRIAKIGQTLLDMTELRIDVPAWEPADTESFLSRSLEQAGGQASLFDHQAMRRVHDLVDGSPRRVRQLADLALLAAAGTDLDQIDADTVEAVHLQLGMMSTTP